MTERYEKPLEALFAEKRPQMRSTSLPINAYYDEGPATSEAPEKGARVPARHPQRL